MIARLMRISPAVRQPVEAPQTQAEEIVLPKQADHLKDTDPGWMAAIPDDHRNLEILLQSRMLSARYLFPR